MWKCSSHPLRWCRSDNMAISQATKSACRRTGPGDVFGVDEPADPWSVFSLLYGLEYQVPTVVRFGCPIRLAVFHVTALVPCITQDRLNCLGGQECHCHRCFSWKKGRHPRGPFRWCQGRCGSKPK